VHINLVVTLNLSRLDPTQIMGEWEWGHFGDESFQAVTCTATDNTE